MGYLLMRREESMKTRFNKIFSILAVFFFCLTTFTAGAANLKGDEILYLKPGTNWKQSNPRYALYLFTKNGNEVKAETWVNMTDCNGDGTFEVVVPPGDWANLIFCRMDGATSDNNWSNKWHQTGDLTYTSGKNKFTVPNNLWDGAKSSSYWSSQSPTTAQYKILGLGKDWTWGNGLTFGPHSDANNKKEVMYQCLDVQETEAIKVVRNEICYYGQGIVKSGSVAVTYDKDGNIVLSKGVYDLYFDKTTNQLYIGNATPTKAYLIGVEGSDKIEMPLNSAKTEFVLTNQLVKSTDKVKVLLEWSCGATAEYVALDRSVNCSSVKSATSGITMGEGYYDFYFKVNDRVLYLDANKENPANQKYVLMGVGGDWDTGIELSPSDDNDYEMVLLGQRISKENDAIKIVKKTPCGDEFYADVKIESPVPYSGGGSQNIVLEAGTYDFYFDKESSKIYIGGTLDNAKVVHLDPKAEDGSDWEADDARMAVHYRNSDTDNGWVTAEKCNTYYFAQIPEGYTEYFWVRMNPNRTENRWNSDDDGDAKPVWNQSSGIKYDAQKTLTIMKDMEWDCYQTVYSGICGENFDNLNCTFPVAKDTVFVHINQFVENDLCNYVFDSFEQAFAVLKTRSEICDATTKYYGTLKEDEITFKVPVVMLVHYGPEYYRGTEKVGSSGGNVSEAPAIFFRNINKDGGKPLIVRTADPKGNRAVLVHPVIRRSKNIELNNLDIVSDDTLLDNALDIDNGMGRYNREGLEEDFNKIPLPNTAKENATINVTIKNCFVESFGRNCIHLSGVDGVHIENNEFYTKFDFAEASKEVAEDVVDWGGTIKMINSTNIKFLRNNSEGTLATSFFIQGCQGLLIMNNVFWNANSVVVDEFNQGNRTVANIRLVTVDDAESKFPLKNIGIYYNTFFIQNNDAADASYINFDFFRLGGADKESKQIVTKDNMDNFVPTTIRFKYNNCYSYDDDIIGNNRYDTKKEANDPVNAIKYYLQGIGEIIYKQGKTEAEAKIMEDWCACFSYNNFWSEYDKKEGHSSSNFEIGMFCTGDNETFNLYQDVSTQVCKTSPTNPGSLVVLGGEMNIGTVITDDDDVSLQGANKLYNDRLNPDNGIYSARPQVVVDNSIESLNPYDNIYIEPGVINLYTSPLVGSQTTDVHISSLDLSKQQVINLTLVDKNGNALTSQNVDEKLRKSFGLTDANGNAITSLETESGNLNNVPVYVTFARPAGGVDDNITYEIFLEVVPAIDNYFILRIPIRGHHRAKIESIPGAWTVGAFQQRNAMPVDTIVWHGTTSSDWDNRNNWYKTDGTLVTCLDALTEDLTVIIPNKDSEKYITPPEGITQYPILPADISTIDGFTTDRHEERVNAGSNDKATKVANKIYMEYGAALVGVEELAKGTPRYAEVEQEFVARRHDWLLVGPVVKPWGDDGKAREVVSGDYFLNDLPHVYMHRAEIKENPKTHEMEAMWNESFPELDSLVTHEKAFAIRLPNQYGRNLDLFGMKFEKLPAEVYNELFPTAEGVPYDGNAPHTYSFKGRFYNEASLPTYTLGADIAKDELVILNNSYPANIDAQELKAGLGGIEIQYYNYEDKGFVVLGDDDKSIMAQHSFIIPKTLVGKQTINIERSWFQTTETGHRSASVDTESFRIELRNKAASSASEIYICYDPLKEDALNYSVDATKIFNTMEPSLPDLYAIRYNKRLSGLVIPTISEPIPLGINVSAEDQSFTFSLKKTSLQSDIILEDRSTGKQCNLSEGLKYTVDDLPIGLCEGRFYLMLQEQEEERPGDDVSTEVEDGQSSAAGIDIFTQGNSVVVSASSDVELMQVIVSDVSGRHQLYNVSGQYVQLNLPVATGVYTISVIGDKANRVEKIRLN